MKNTTDNYSLHKLSRLFSAALLTALVSLIPGTLLLVKAQTLEDFGYGRLQVRGKEARGTRPLLVILAEHEDYPALAHDRDYYDNLIFNYFATDADGRPINNLNAYYSVNSNGRFSWTRAGAGVYGPFSFTGADLGEYTDSKAQPRQALALQAAAEAGFNFADYDNDGDGYVTNDELCVLVIENLTMDDAANRPTKPGCVRPAGSSVSACLAIAIVGHQASLMSMAHELAHSLGAMDLYGADKGQNYEYTVMGSTMYKRADIMRTYHFDPWHKIQLGWVEPKVYSLDTPGSETLGAAELLEGDEPVILYSPTHGTNEYFLLEYRTNNRPGGAGYDANVPGSGLVLWHIKTDDNKVPVTLPSLTQNGELEYAVFIYGANNFTRGTGTPWPSSTGRLFDSSLDGVIPHPLKWLDGFGGKMKLKVGRTTDNGERLQVSWDEYAIPESLKVQRRMFYYNGNQKSAAVALIDEQNNVLPLNSYAPGAFGQWTHIVGDATDLFYYNTYTGAAALGYLSAEDQHHTTASYPAGYFGPGWTHIVRHKGYLFFYSARDGRAAIGQMTAQGFKSFASYAPYSFGLNWTRIVSTTNGLIFYNAVNGSGVVGDWEYVYSGAPGGFASITGVKFKQLRGYGPGSFANGWTQIVETNNGVLFYRSTDGLHVMTDVAANGAISTRSNSLQTLRRGWSHIIAVNDDILFYDQNTGDGAIGEIQKASPLVLASTVGRLTIVQNLPGFFSSGWTHLTTTIDPTFIR